MPYIAIRPAVAPDAHAISEILNHYVTRSTATLLTTPQTPDDQLAWLDNRSIAHPVVVADMDDTVVGWASLSAFRSQAGYEQTAEVSVYVRHDRHRRGVGRALVNELIARGRVAGLHVLVGGCCSESTASIALLESFGFSRAGHFTHVGYKFDRWLDLVMFQRTL
jgi:phosphinothricin acetyltransferase